MRNDGCTWLHEGVVFVSKFDFFIQQELVIIILKLQLRDWGLQVCRGLGLKSNNKICNLWHNVGFILIFSG
jgi:hypothetical protein